jgi:hypothetical protein
MQKAMICGISTNNNLYDKRARPTKNEPQQQEISYLKRKREVRAGRSAGRHI